MDDGCIAIEYLHIGKEAAGACHREVLLRERLYTKSMYKLKVGVGDFTK